MTELNALLLPLLGGFLFVTLSYRTRYFIGRQPTRTLTLWLAAAGLLLLLVARLIVWSVESAIPGPGKVAIPVVSIALPAFAFCTLLGLALYPALEFAKSGRIARSPWWRLPIALVLGVTAALILIKSVETADRPIGLPKALTLNGARIIVVLAILYWCYQWHERTGLSAATVTFRLAVVSLVWTLIATIVLMYPESTKDLWGKFVRPLDHEVNTEMLGVAFLACLLGPAAAVTLNVVYPKVAVTTRLFDQGAGNAVDQLIYRATKLGRMIIVTMDDGKVYCGFVKWVPPDPEAPDTHLVILPVLSGFRDPASKAVELPVNYAGILASLSRDQRGQFRKVIPTGRIVVVGEFDPKYYERFRAPADGKSVAEHVAKLTAETR